MELFKENPEIGTVYNRKIHKAVEDAWQSLFDDGSLEQKD